MIEVVDIDEARLCPGLTCEEPALMYCRIYGTWHCVNHSYNCDVDVEVWDLKYRHT